jgi:3-oxoacyl-[acyl-carrier protein] reductase
MPVDLERLEPGTEASLSEVITAEHIAATAQLTGDDNPLHTNAEQARSFGHSRTVAHGVILLGIVSRLIGTRLPGAGSVWFENRVEFLAPVYAGDEVRLTARVARVSPATRIVVLDLEAVTTAGVPVLRGQAKVRVPAPAPKGRSTMSDAHKVAVVTGASRGLGRAVAEALAGGGWQVVVNYRTDREGADACVTAVAARGGKAFAIAADVGRADGARGLFDASVDAFGRVDGIVHCATPTVIRKPWVETSSDEFRAYFDTYVVALHELVRLAAPSMTDRAFGRVVAVLSSAIAEVPRHLTAYTVGKAALLALCRSLAVELGPSNIRVNTVTPSLLVGPQADALGAAARETVIRRTPMRRLADVDEVARVVMFLMSEEASFVSGANLPVTGGLFI